MKRLCLVLLMLVPSAVLSAAPPRIACIGDSITEGTYDNVYPDLLGVELGAGFTVMNFGVGGATVLENGAPYWRTEAYQKALHSRPDVVILMLGTNDAKKETWSRKSQFLATYKRLIQSFQKLPSKPKIFICLPPETFDDTFGIQSDVLKNEVLPLIEKAAKDARAPLIDLHAPFAGRKDLLSDLVHPNQAGALLIAKTVKAAITGEAPAAAPAGAPQAATGALAPLPDPNRLTASAELLLPKGCRPSIPPNQVVDVVVELKFSSGVVQLTSTADSFWVTTTARGAADRLFLVQNKGAAMAGQYGFGASRGLTVNGSPPTTSFTFIYQPDRIQNLRIAKP